MDDACGLRITSAGPTNPRIARRMARCVAW